MKEGNKLKDMKCIDVFDENYYSLIEEVEIIKEKKLIKLKSELIKNLPFKKGDIIYNVTGIIEIKTIDIKVSYNGRGERLPTQLRFTGPKYKWVKGGLVTRTKTQKNGNLHYYGKIKKIDKCYVV